MKLGLGTAQFGLNYGISNSDGQTPPEEVEQILRFAWDRDIRTIDTASLYGTSEHILGNTIPKECDFRIVTKTPAFDCPKISPHHADKLEAVFVNSLRLLDCQSLYGLMAHHAEDLLAENGEQLFKRMVRLKDEGKVTKIGVSVYSPQQVDDILDRYAIDLIQVPVNVLDQRLIAGGQLSRLKEHGVEIHARSAFLQGILLMSPDSLPDYFNSIRQHLHHFHNYLRGKEISPLQAALSFIEQNPNIDLVVCGVNNCQQLQELCDASSAKCHVDFSQFSIHDELILNPAKWKI